MNTTFDITLFSPYDPHWADRFRTIAARLRNELEATALRIDHIGSTAVPGLAAKPIIDIQISVASLEPMELYSDGIERCGFVLRADNTDRTKRYFRERPGERRTHVHVRRLGGFAEQQALLFRDYLRTHDDRAAAYAALKTRLAPLLAFDRQAYLDGKADFIWETLRLAHEWSQHVGWEPGSSDG